MKIRFDWLRTMLGRGMRVDSQLASILGIDYPLKHGWINDILSRDYDMETIKLFRTFALERLVRLQAKEERKAERRRKHMEDLLSDNQELIKKALNHSLSFDDMKKI